MEHKSCQKKKKKISELLIYNISTEKYSIFLIWDKKNTHISTVSIYVQKYGDFSCFLQFKLRVPFWFSDFLKNVIISIHCNEPLIENKTLPESNIDYGQFFKKLYS